MQDRTGDAAAPRERPRMAALQLALGYAAAASLWILGSDWLLARLIRDPDWLMQAGAIKGWSFVALTALLLYALQRRGLGPAAATVPGATAAQAGAAAPLPAARDALRVPALRWPAAAIVALTLLALVGSYQQRRAQQLQQIEAVAEQQAGQVATWFSYRQAQARFVRASLLDAADYQRWRDGAALGPLLERLVVMREAFGNQAAFVFNHRGELVAAEPGRHDEPYPELREQVWRAAATGEIRQWVGGDHDSVWIDMVIPVQGTGGPARLVAVLRMGLDDSLLPLLRAWPAAVPGGQSLLARREEDMLVGLFGKHPLPVDHPGLLAGRAVLGQIPLGRASEGLDFRGVPVVGVVRLVPGAEWLLVAKLDAAKLHGESLKDALWIAATGALALLGLLIAAVRARERRALADAQAQRAAQEERLRALALVQAVTDSVLDHMAVLDREGTIVKVNAAWTRFAAENGFSLDGTGCGHGLGANYLHVCAATQGQDAAAAAQVAEGIAAVLAGTRPAFSHEYACHAPQRRRWFHMTVTPLRTEGGGAVVVHSDITERQEAQAQLRKLSLAVAQSPIGIAIRDTAGHLEYVNDAFTRMSGFAREELLGRHAGVLQSALAPALQEAPLWQALQRGEAWAGELHSRRRDGEPYDVFVHAAPIRQGDGRITHHLWIGEDVTEQKRIAAELDRHRHRLQELVEARTLQLRRANDELVLARDRADAANRAKSAFLANMSHEIRTPLNAILGLTHLLRRDARDAVALERLVKVGNAAAHLLQVVNDVLDLSKIEAGRLELEEAPFSLRALLAGSHALVAEQARAKGLALSVDAGDVPDALCGDATRLSQALLNLLSNAVKFTEHGRVEVRADVLERGERGLLLGLHVRDTGIGIAPGKLGQVFGAFVQEDASTTRRFGGTGLGLAITQRLATLMGGQVGVRSEPGVGSEFRFSAWVREGRPAAPAALPPPGAPAAVADVPLPSGDAGADAELLRRRCGGARVLLAEDDPISQGVAQELLHWAGMEVQTVDNGAQALAAARACAPDLILMDVQMPEMDGLEATRHIRALPGRATTPVLALTANAFAADRDRCLAAGMDDHVPKPVDPAALFAALLRWLPARAPGTPGRAQTAATVPQDAAGPARAAAPGAEAAVSTPAPAATPEPGAVATAGEDASGGAAPGSLPEVPGLDAALALRYLGGQAGLYRRVLRQFLRHHAGAPQRTRAALAAGGTDALKALVHGLWGTAEPIGAAGLARQARALDRALAAGAPPQALAADVEALLEELQRLLHAIGRALTAAAAEAEAGAGAATVDGPGLQTLARLLREGDYAAVAAWRSLAPALRRLDPAAAAELDARLLDFDFEGAVDVVEKLQPV